MLSKIYRLLTAITIFVTAVACNDRIEVDETLHETAAPGAITISLRNTEMSRANSSDKNPENIISNLYIGLYADNDFGAPDENTAAIYWIKPSDLSELGSPALPDWDSYTVTFPLTSDLTRKLFNNADGAECSFYVIANIPEDVLVPDNASIATMKSIPIESNFKEVKEQASFVMAGEGKIKYTAPNAITDKGLAKGEADLIRAAAKISLNIGITDVEVKDEDGNIIQTWEPVTDSETNPMIVLINNGVQNAVTAPEEKVDGFFFEPWSPADPAAYYSSDLAVENSFRILTSQPKGADDHYPYKMDVPFYSYPNVWEESPEETHKTTLTLMVPWKLKGSETRRNYYYQVPVTPDWMIERNYSYTINLTVAMLGSEGPENPVELSDLSYEIVDWSETDIPVSIPDVRYLVVSPDKYIINNQSVISIPFYTSHPVIIEKFTMTFPQFNFPGDGSGERVEITVDKDVLEKSVIGGEKMVAWEIVPDPVTNVMTLRITHPMIWWQPLNLNGHLVSLQEVPLDGTAQQTADTIATTIDRFSYPDYNQLAYFPYTFHITLRHEDNSLFSDDVVITQYPGMYIENDPNPGETYLSYDSDNYFSTSTPQNYKYGYTYLNPAEFEYDKQTGWRNADTKWYGAGNADVYYPALKKMETGEDQAKKLYLDFNNLGMGGLRPFKGNSTSGDVTNPNMYVINITQLSESDSRFIIGNPRSSFINNDLSGSGDLLTASEAPALKFKDTNTSENWCQPARALYNEADDLDENGKRTLRYYYPTREDDEAAMMVAPKLRVSSAYGFVRNNAMIVDREIGRRRAATYQEQGYPAGRWRLPTKGEVEFIVKLSMAGKIPTLFNTSQNYLTAQGAYSIDENGELQPLTMKLEVVWNGSQWVLKNAVTANVRPVYDEWYWENEEEYILQPDETTGYTYTLGDMPARSVN